MSKATKKKHVRQEVCDPESWEPPGPGRALARVLAGRGNNLHEVMVAGEIPSAHTTSSSQQIAVTNVAVVSSSSEHKEETVITQDDDDKVIASGNVTSSGGDAKIKGCEKTDDWAERRILASMPRKFRRSVWVRRGDIVVIEWIPEGDKVKAEIVSVVLRKIVRDLRAAGELQWPPEFDHPDFGDVEKCRSESESGDEDDDPLPANTNRRAVPVVIDSSSSTSSTSSSSSSSSDDEDFDDEAAGSVFENPNRRTVSRSLSKSDSSVSDDRSSVNGSKGDVVLNLKN